jgi:hypothetical protein
MKNKTRKTTKALKIEIAKLEAAYNTVGAEDASPSDAIAAIELILSAYKESQRRLTRELRGMIRRTVKLTAASAATAEQL